jgi:hypothetical protein
MIYIIGDSHCAIFTIINNKYMTPEYQLIKTSNFCSFRTKPFTAYNLNTKIKHIEEIIKTLNIQNNDYLIFSYGEVDIRCHLGFHSTDTYTLNNKIKECVDRYIEFILYFKKKYNNIGIWAPIASGGYNGLNGNGRPSYKTKFERNLITHSFITILEKLCIQYDIIFKSIFNELITNEGGTNDAYYADGVHLNINAQPLVINKFKDLLSLK